MSGKTASDYEAQYTRPRLRERLKEELKQSSKGGKRGQWSARKSQLLTQRYEGEGGDYKGPKTGPQKSLEAWSEPNSGEPTRKALYERAKALDIRGRSRMNKAALARALRKAG